MQITQNAKRTFDACRFCWMCRHICPIGGATGKECHTARARALSLSLVERGAYPLEGDIVDNLYDCALCGACTADCATGFDPVVFTKETRLAAALEGHMPAYVEKLLDVYENTGSIYGKAPENEKLAALTASHAKKADVLFYVGSDARAFIPEKAAEAAKLLEKCGISFMMLADEPDSGYALDFLLGKADETTRAMKKCADAIAASGAKVVVCYDPADARVMKHEYRDYGVTNGLTAETFPAFLNARLPEKLPKADKNADYSLQDSPFTVRDLDDTASARGVLGRCGTLKEFLLYGKNTVLAGNLVMNAYRPAVMALVAARRLSMAKAEGLQTVVTESVADYVLLKAAGGEITVKTLEEVVASCLSD